MNTICHDITIEINVLTTLNSTVIAKTIAEMLSESGGDINDHTRISVIDYKITNSYCGPDDD